MKTKKKDKVVTPTTTPDSASDVQQETLPETVPLTRSRVNAARIFITDFVKEYYKHPQCPAHAMQKVIDDYKLDDLLNSAEDNMTAAQLYEEAHKLFECGLLLNENYSKNYDQANARIKAVLEQHAPEILKEIENRKKIEDGEKE